MVSYSDAIFTNYKDLPASSLLIGVFFYTIQIYADFSGYSDMALGFARLIGFNITRNFDNPFFSQNISDYWHRWHISLTAWLTEYIFTPLSIKFRDYGKMGLILAIVVNFVICGIWHGANWTYLLFGSLHGCYFIPLIIRGTINKRKSIADESFKLFPTFNQGVNMLKTFLLVMLTFVVFRAENIRQAFDYYLHMINLSILSVPVLYKKSQVIIALFFTFFMLTVQWLQKDKQHGLDFNGIKIPVSLRWIMYYAIIIAIYWFRGAEQSFIYFQF